MEAPSKKEAEWKKKTKQEMWNERQQRRALLSKHSPRKYDDPRLVSFTFERKAKKKPTRDEKMVCK